jgi:hypothetical protein
VFDIKCFDRKRNGGEGDGTPLPEPLNKVNNTGNYPDT